MKRICIIGAGPSGIVCARLLAEKNHSIDIFDKRKHVAGNCYDEYDEFGLLNHRYGPHYFRTNSLELLNWLSQFTSWTPGRYYVKSMINGQLYSIPIGPNTLTKMKGTFFSVESFSQYLKDNVTYVENPQNAEDFCLNSIGRELYELFFKNYTKKQWGVGPRDLPPSIVSRIPIRFSYDERYPSETFQFLPKDGYTKLFSNMINHENIHLKLESTIQHDDLCFFKKNYDLIIYTGPIDYYFQYRYGHLGYRSLGFEWKFHPVPFYQPYVQINYPNDYDYTRTLEIKHITEQQHAGTSVCYEYPEKNGEPFYPVPTTENQTKYLFYHKLAQKELEQKTPTFFLGRLAEYRYFNMDHVMLNGHKLVKKIEGMFYDQKGIDT